MRWISKVAFAAANLASIASAAVYVDPETGLTFAQYEAPATLNSDIIYRIAVPANAAPNTAFDAVLQIVAPTGVGWAGLAWGGRMPNNPLAVAWGNGQGAIVSSRFATSHTMPQPHAGSTYQTFTTGTRSNNTHWQVTTLCTGCTSWEGRTLNPSGQNRLAYATSPTPPSDPSSDTSPISVHDVTNYWTQDFSEGANQGFEGIVGGLQ
ncbi:hypothetical protein AJ79_05618 [Helicocarpus griseus UAMH5409]|uniref:Cellobiose dehydrogenase-like cytochrome domain-containing protein n=1 Tax=Helicocarpus griseus UAMH5409 TaxID=1447875 RepID=A0A2B7XLY3_9EURO|nr:hypothetical protein AJ79_05618 [Helicocarpus griseus UAMH5409]